ncbi:Transcriptional activatory protein AadR [Ensifer adhaerens]|uniref:Crp/Fnr family transcriptional regulator n=1 Tax=Ensifer adhaerens TaxID=106592 RepID=UPI001568D41D|nr:Crp/Fnr family transcriptional regulator [Ensifer adhaerens]NRP23123.1 Transcriptional activatory protein AadR [Ensifer adhaerens]
MKTLRLNSNDKAVLLGSRFFETLSAAASDAILEGAVVTNHEEHDILFQQDEPVDSVFCVLSGLVRVYRLGKDGREADIAVFPKGELFGENAMFLGNRATANAQAIGSSTIARLDSRNLRKLAEQYPDIAQALMELLCRHGQMAEDCLAEDRLLTAPQRVASYILGHCPDGSTTFSFRLPFQKNVLAGKLGLAPEALSRAFSALRRSGVTVKGRMIEIHDRQALERF